MYENFFQFTLYKFFRMWYNNISNKNYYYFDQTIEREYGDQT